MINKESVINLIIKLNESKIETLEPVLPISEYSAKNLRKKINRDRSPKLLDSECKKKRSVKTNWLSFYCLKYIRVFKHKKKKIKF